MSLVAEHPRSILVVMPNWLGDGVMATPLLRAMRLRYPQARIVALHKPLLGCVLEGLGCIDHAKVYPGYNAAGAGRIDMSATLAWLGKEAFDQAVLLPNSFRSAWLCYRAGIPQRIGYAREGRRWLLTHSLAPQKRSRQEARDRAAVLGAIERQKGGAFWPLRLLWKRWTDRPFQPLATLDYYLQLALALDAPSSSSRQMFLGVSEAEAHEATGALAELGNEVGMDSNQPLAILIPGANFGSSKCWLPERFAQVAAHLAPRGWQVAIGASPAEAPLVAAILREIPAGVRVLNLRAANKGQGLSLGGLKALVQRSRLMVCNDTGPRHFAAAFGIPTVTLFGPTDPRWAETFSEHEIQLRLTPACSPCQLKRCPLDHRCMRELQVRQVTMAIESLLR